MKKIDVEKLKKIVGAENATDKLPDLYAYSGDACKLL